MAGQWRQQSAKTLLGLHMQVIELLLVHGNDPQIVMQTLFQ